MIAYADQLQMTPQPAPQFTGEISMRTLLHLLLEQCPERQIRILFPFEEMKARTVFECAAGTIGIEFSTEFSHRIARHLTFTGGIQGAAVTEDGEGLTGSPGDTTVRLESHTTDWTVAV